MSRALPLVAVIIVAFAAAWVLLADTPVPEPAPTQDATADVEAPKKKGPTINYRVAEPAKPAKTLPDTRPRHERIGAKGNVVLSKAPPRPDDIDAVLQHRIDTTMVRARGALKVWAGTLENKEDRQALDRTVRFMEDQLHGLQRQFDMSSQSSKGLTVQLDRVLTETRKRAEASLGEPPPEAAKLLKTSTEMPEELPDQQNLDLDWGEPLNWE